MRANAEGDGLYPPASSSQQEPAIVVRDGFKGDYNPVDGGGLRPDCSLFVSRSAVETGPVQGGSDNKPGGGETCQEGLHLHFYMQADHEERVVGGEQAGRTDLPRSDIEKKTVPLPFFELGNSRVCELHVSAPPQLNYCFARWRKHRTPSLR